MTRHRCDCSQVELLTHDATPRPACERQTCGKCRRPFYDLNRPGAQCPHCQPKPVTPAEPETPMPMPSNERRELVRKLLTEAPRRMGELEAAVDAKAPTIRSDLTALGATQTGNRLSPWTLPETPTEAPVEKPARKKRAPVAEAAAVEGDVTTLSMQHLVACTNELTRRAGRAQVTRHRCDCSQVELLTHDATPRPACERCPSCLSRAPAPPAVPHRLDAADCCVTCRRPLARLQLVVRDPARIVRAA